jgi:hypothetical protein
VTRSAGPGGIAVADRRPELGAALPESHAGSRAAPPLARTDRGVLHRRASGLLTALIVQEGGRVRAALAAVLADMPHAPAELIMQRATWWTTPPHLPTRRLAGRLAPLLSGSDLLALTADPADAVPGAALGAGDGAMAKWLAHDSASVREAVLDALGAGAAQHRQAAGQHHGPVTLSASAARALGDVVTAHVLRSLRRPTRANPGVDRIVTTELRRRLTNRSAPLPGAALVQAGRAPGPEIEAVLCTVRGLQADGSLTEATLLEAAAQGDALLCAVLLAVAAGVNVQVVRRAAMLRSAKGLVSLVWQAGFAMSAALPVQDLLGRLPPDAILRPTPQGGFPVSIDEMRWQVDFLRTAGP